MHHYGYTGLQIVHDQQIKAALGHQCLDKEQTTQRPRLLQSLKKFFARFNIHLAENEQELLPDCAQTPSFFAEAASSRSYRQENRCGSL